MQMLKLALLIQCVFYLFLTFPVQAAKVEDIRILIDVSGSMQKTDPQNLRVPALHLINGLIPTGSKAGVWTFGRYVNMEVKWGLVNARWRKLADAGTKKIHSKGQFTNIESAIERATKGWEKADPNTNRNLILLTDGKVDISKDSVKNAQSHSRVLTRSVPALVKKGVKVHTIALSDQTDEDLLKHIALKTSGSFEVAESAEDLQRIFLHMFERAIKPDTVPLKDNMFTIDKTISEMTLLVFRKGGKKTQLIQPDKKKNTEKKHAKNVNWRYERGYDLITVIKPQAGKWRLIAYVDNDNRVMIVTKLKLVIDELPAYITPDEALQIKLELHSNNKKISKKSFLKFVDFKLQHLVDNKTENIVIALKKSRKVKDKGIYLSSIPAPLAEGRHEILVSADARTFERNKRLTIEVQWPIKVEIGKTDQPGEYRLSMLARDEYIKVESLELEASLKRPDQSQQSIEINTRGNQLDLPIMANKHDGLHQISIKMKAETLEGKIIEHTLDDYPVMGIKVIEKPVVKEPVETALPSETKSKGTANNVLASEKQNDDTLKEKEIINEFDDNNETDWVTTSIYLAVINGVIMLIIAGVIIFIRKRKKVDDIDELAELETDDEDEVLIDD